MERPVGFDGREGRPQTELHARHLSPRFLAIVDALLLKPGVRILEIDCGPGEAPYDLAFAVRVGALDGRHSKPGEATRTHLAAALKPKGRLFTDGGDPLREVALKGMGK